MILQKQKIGLNKPWASMLCKQSYNYKITFDLDAGLPLSKLLFY